LGLLPELWNDAELLTSRVRRLLVLDELRSTAAQVVCQVLEVCVLVNFEIVNVERHVASLATGLAGTGRLLTT